MEDLVAPLWALLQLLVQQQYLLLQGLQLLQLQVMHHQMLHQMQPHGAPWNDLTGARGSRSLHLPLGRPRQTPQVGGLPTYYTAPDFSTIDKNRPLPAIFAHFGSYEMCCQFWAFITKAQSSFCTRAQGA
jgi:hypothetical protein